MTKHENFDEISVQGEADAEENIEVLRSIDRKPTRLIPKFVSIVPSA